jgi:uncharacterized coiled-coil DUF342 family protein
MVRLVCVSSSIVRKTAIHLSETASRLRETVSRVRETASRVRGTASRVRETASRVREAASRVRGTASRLRETASRVRETASRLRETASRLRETGNFSNCIGLWEREQFLSESPSEYAPFEKDVRKTGAPLWSYAELSALWNPAMCCQHCLNKS